MSIPYTGFSNTALGTYPEVKAGDLIDCPHCGEKHLLKDSEPPLLLFYSCGKYTYLAGVAGRSILGMKPNVPGKA
jgi:hypothetical protein